MNTPTAEHRVQLDAYAGPLDLLLYLVKRHEIDLQDVPMAELVEQYMAHLRVIETIDVEKAGEFLVMAATLVEIKSQLLVPHVMRSEDEDGEGAERPDADPDIDPRFELVQQLLAYKRFKDAALELEDRAEQWETRFPAHARAGKAQADAAGDADPDGTEALPLELDLDDVNILDLCAAFGRVMDSIGHLGDHEVTYDDTPISLHADDIADRLARDGGERKRMTLVQVFQGRTRGEMIGLFLATLELVRQRKVRVTQDENLGEIALELTPEEHWETTDTIEAEETPDWTDSQTGEVQYDWPDEATKRRALRRAERREKWYEKRDDAEKDPGDSADDPMACRTDDSQDELKEGGEAIAGDVDAVLDDPGPAEPPPRPQPE